MKACCIYYCYYYYYFPITTGLRVNRIEISIEAASVAIRMPSTLTFILLYSYFITYIYYANNTLFLNNFDFYFVRIP